jgi:hypothetical protein
MSAAKQKKEFFENFVSFGDVIVVVNTTVSGVTVPPEYSNLTTLKLSIGLEMPVPIPDLKIEDDGITCTLSFNREPYFCVLPWEAIWQMVPLIDPKLGIVWKSDIPADIRTELEQRKKASTKKAKEVQNRKSEDSNKNRRPFGIVDGEGKGGAPNKPKLRLVK